MLTGDEQRALHALANVAGLLAVIVGRGPTRRADLAELYGHVHALQQAVMSQAAARAYPEQFRLLGEGHSSDVIPA